MIQQHGWISNAYTKWQKPDRKKITVWLYLYGILEKYVIGTENTSGLAWVRVVGGVDCNGHQEELFQWGEIILYLDQNSCNCTSKRVKFILCKFKMNKIVITTIIKI